VPVPSPGAAGGMASAVLSQAVVAASRLQSRRAKIVPFLRRLLTEHASEGFSLPTRGFKQCVRARSHLISWPAAICTDTGCKGKRRRCLLTTFSDC
jgi:hypothetical protein